MLNAIIVDDERHCRDALENLVAKHRSFLDLKSSVSTVSAAIEAIETFGPDVVFLDVHLQNETGFDLLKQLDRIDFYIIFTTAYEAYAVNAFKYSAFDYLLKPIDPDEFQETLNRLRDRRNEENHAKKLEVLFHNFEARFDGVKKIAIPTVKDFTFLNVSDVVRCESDGNYTHIFTARGKKLTSTRTLKYFEEFLGDVQFFRIHKSHYVNLAHVEKYIKGKGGYVVMSDGARLEVAVRRKDDFLRRLGN
ncbi:LytR/AlgR family response regulator transcription factor [Pseudozobellia thermophila]|uniref:Two component transcriptional regulator, LytTR family n=1 Tax=Pseudozobellia thermophila TaxID=192903 RepID=A0A1M6MLI4_9FLAO|nr:LytTR family DNA-binding domain-containing protein [Pseudozobellia thermophila]SHJ84327.1 two component transcriptional regulator, LytTR family [Pseudozobellia thermophila]